MRPTQTLLALPLALLMAAPAAFAQDRHIVDPSALAATVDQHAARQDADRAAVRDALATPAVRDAAARLGVDVDRLRASAATLGGDDLAQVASTARELNQSLVGGASSVTISTTTIIVALLVVILLIVALK